MSLHPLLRSRHRAQPISEAELRAYAATGGKWTELAKERGIDRSSLIDAVTVLGINRRDAEPVRVRMAMMRALASGSAMTVAELQEASNGTDVHVKAAIQRLRDAVLIKSVARRVLAEDPCKPWAQYVITAAGLQSVGTE